jgi:BASS family bile acid:Na+ symporter
VSSIVPEWLVSAFAVATVMVVMFEIGLDIAPGEFLWIWRRPALVLRAFFAIFVAMPILAIGVSRALQLARVAEVGLVVMAIAPGAPIALRRSLAAGGDRAFAPGLQVTVALLAVLTMPLSVAVLDELYAASASISPWQLLKQVWFAQFLPLVVGIAFGQLRSRWAAWLRPRLARLAQGLLIALLALALAAFWGVMLAAGPRVAIAIVLTTAAALFVGHALGGPEPATRTAVAISTAARNPGLALLAAALNSAAPGVRITILTYLVVAGLTITPYAIWRARQAR